MKIAGFQSLTLLDYPGRTSAIVFTQGCAFRCAYCHNPELIPTEGSTTLDEEDVLDKLMARRAMVDAVCITGGEPTLQPDLLEFIGKLKDSRFAVKLDTNGLHPSMIRSVIEQKLVDYLAMDLKHVWEKYDDVIRMKNARVVENCRETFSMIQESGIAHEFRTTVFPGVHSEEDFYVMAGYLRPNETYALQQIRLEKTLDPDLRLRKGMMLDMADLTRKIRERYPALRVSARE